MEPGRTNAYSNDLRWRIVWHLISKGHNYRFTAKQLCVSIGTVHNIMKLFENTREVTGKPAPSRLSLRALNDQEELLVIGIVLKNPTVQLSEICKILANCTNTIVSNATLCRLLKKYVMTRKRIQTIALQRSCQIRSQFMAEVQYFPKEMFVWVDETGSDRRDSMRKYGYSLRGYRSSKHRLVTRGRLINTIAAITTNGILSYELYTQSINSDIFYDFF